MAPSSVKQWTITSTEKGFDGLEFGEAQLPKVGENDVVVKIQGASLNYRDLIIPKVSLFQIHRYSLSQCTSNSDTDALSSGPVSLPCQSPHCSPVGRCR